MKILVIGIDGATWDVLTDDVLAQHMPQLFALRRGGTSGILESTFPAVTPSAWTSCTSGCSPHIHGLTDFQRYAFDANTVELANSTAVKVPSMWDYLGEAGLSVASLNVPFTYPTYPVNGVMVSGLGCAGTQSDFVYPNEFKKTILERIPDYGIALGPEGLNKRNNGLGTNREEFESNIRRLERRFAMRVELARLVQETHPADVMMVQFQQLDLLQHLAWPYIAADRRDEHPFYRDRIFELLKRLDDCVGELLDLIDLNDGLVLVASDHGFGPMDHTVCVNKLLCDWGYIERANTWNRIVRRTRRNLMHFKALVDRRMSMDLKQPVNWHRTRAMVLRRPIYAALYLNVRGRQPGGCVEPNGEYDQLLAELKERFLGYRNPLNGEQVFERVETPRERWGDFDDAEQLFGDLMLVQKQGYRVAPTMKQSAPAVFASACDDLTASWHHPAGIYIAAGQNIKKDTRSDARITDIVPSIYAHLGMPIPAEVDGSPIAEAFIESPSVTKTANRQFPHCFAQRSGVTQESEEERAQLAEQLKNLGYLD